MEERGSLSVTSSLRPTSDNLTLQPRPQMDVNPSVLDELAKLMSFCESILSSVASQAPTPLSPHVVLLYNDDEHSFSDVIAALQAVATLTPPLTPSGFGFTTRRL
jgi:hypothetical protein